MQLQASKMTFPACLLSALCCMFFLSDLAESTSLVKVKNTAGSFVSIDPDQANDFLSNSRPKRNIDPKWHRGNPDFQSYYRYYNSIGHVEGLYEIDRIRMLYHQMRYLELTYGPDASGYQNALGFLTTTVAPTTTTQPPPPPTTAAPTPDPLENAHRIYLCNPKDPLCKPQIVYLPTGAVPVLCDPRLHPACKAKTQEDIKPLPESQPASPPPASEKSEPPAPPASGAKGMEYDCDPYWDPDCLIDHPPRPVQETVVPAEPADEKEVKEQEETAEESVPATLPPAKQKSQHLYYDPYDSKHDLYDPFRYTQPAPDPQ